MRVAEGNQVLRDPSKEDYHERRQKSVSQEVQHRRKHWNREPDYISQRDRTLTGQKSLCTTRQIFVDSEESGILHLNICLSRQVVAAVLCELWTRKNVDSCKRVWHMRRGGQTRPMIPMPGNIILEQLFTLKECQSSWSNACVADDGRGRKEVKTSSRQIWIVCPPVLSLPCLVISRLG